MTSNEIENFIGSFKMKKILIVDDEPSIVRLLSLRLKHNNYNVLEADNGLNCLKVANKYKPDLILMDIKMPICDGIKAFGMLKESDETSDIPVLFMTAFPTPELVKKVYKMGAKGCISKPFISSDFEREIQNALA